MKLNAAYHSFIDHRPRALLTRTKYHSKLRAFLAEYGGHSLRQITPEMVCHHFQSLERRGLAAATLASHRAAIMALFNYCLSRGWLRKNPATALPRYSDTPAAIKYPDEADIEAVLATCRHWAKENNLQKRRDAAIFYTSATSAPRRGEIKNLRHSATVAALAHPTINGGYAIPTTGKTGAAVIVLTEEAADIMRAYLHLRPPVKHDKLWVSTEPRANFAPLGDNGLQHVRKRLCTATGVKIVTYQQIRRWRARHIGQQYGVAIGSQSLGHRSGTNTFTRFYYNPTAEMATAALLATAPTALLSQG